MQEKNPDSFGGKMNSEIFQNLEMSRSCEEGGNRTWKLGTWEMQLLRHAEATGAEKKKQFIADFVTHCNHFCEENEGKKEGREREKWE